MALVHERVDDSIMLHPVVEANAVPGKTNDFKLNALPQSQPDRQTRSLKTVKRQRGSHTTTTIEKRVTHVHITNHNSEKHGVPVHVRFNQQRAQ